MDWSKFLSRKLLLTLLTIAIIVGADLLGAPLDEGTLNMIVTLVLGLVGAQGVVDTAAAWSTGQAIASTIDAVSTLVEEVKETDDGD